MNIFKMSESYAGKMKWYDFSLIKATVLFSTLFLVTAWEGFRNFVLGIEWYWFLILAVIFAIPVIKKLFSS